MKLIGKRSAGKPHAAFDAAGAGNMVCKDACASPRPYVCPAKAGVFRGIKPSREKVGSPLAWVAVVEEMKPLKSTDNIF